MARDAEKKYTIGFNELKKKFSSGNIPNNILLFTPEKILFEELISTLGNNFIGKNFNQKTHLKLFYSDDKNIEDVINECSNFGFFSDKKIVIYKIVKRSGVKGITSDDRNAIFNYLDWTQKIIERQEPVDAILVLLVQDKEYSFSNFEQFEDKNIEIYVTGLTSEIEIFQWVKQKFSDFKISDETINHFLQFLNPSVDEINTEIEKLKTYCALAKEITFDSVNLCVGASKDFDENDFIDAVFSRDTNKALKIYDNMSLKEDVEIYFLVLLSSAFIGITKLFDPKIGTLNEFQLKRELKVWNNAKNRIEIYKKYCSSTNELKIIKAFDYIYRADKAFKTSSQDKKAVFTTLIRNLTEL